MASSLTDFASRAFAAFLTLAIAVPLASAYHVEYGLLSDDPKFAICDDVACATCNGRRWDRLHHAPALIMRRVIRRILTRARDR